MFRIFLQGASKTPQERLKMMESLFKKFEDEDAVLASENQSDTDDRLRDCKV